MTEREFIHEIMNYLTIADGNIRRVKRALAVENSDKLDILATTESAEKVHEALKRIIDAAKLRREEIINLDNSE